MTTRSLLHHVAALALFGTAAAQAPVFHALPGSAQPTDVTVVNGVPVVVGIDGMSAFRWTPASGLVALGPVSPTVLRVSTDGNTVVGDTIGIDGVLRASYWTLATGWVQLPGMGGVLSNVESSAVGVDADGTVIVGAGYVAGNASHGFRWTAATGMVDLTPPFSMPTSRGVDVEAAGDLVVGSADLLNGQRVGARWLNGVKTDFTYVDPSNVSYFTGGAYAVNSGGTVAVGQSILGIAGVSWRWDAATNLITPLPNLPTWGIAPFVGDATDDGTMVVGGTGAQIGVNEAVLWLQGQAPQRLHAYLLALGAPIGAFTDLGTAYAVSRNGRVFVGKGAGGGFGQPSGWVIEFPKAGVPFCFGDGTQTDHTTPCPCANTGAPGHGCAHSANAGGAELDTTGLTTTDDVVLRGTGMPGTVACIYLQGDGLTDNVFGDGVRCTGGTLLRLRTKVNVAGASSFPDSVETVTLSQRGGVTPGSGVRRYYQTYYRNAAAAFCPPETYNITNGVFIDW